MGGYNSSLTAANVKEIIIARGSTKHQSLEIRFKLKVKSFSHQGYRSRLQPFQWFFPPCKR